MTRPHRRYPKWTQAELDDMRARQDAGETLDVQKQIMVKVLLANQPWWRRWRTREGRRAVLWTHRRRRAAFLRLIYLVGLAGWLTVGVLITNRYAGYSTLETIAVEMGIAASWTVGFRYGQRVIP